MYNSRSAGLTRQRQQTFVLEASSFHVIFPYPLDNPDIIPTVQ